MSTVDPGSEAATASPPLPARLRREWVPVTMVVLSLATALWFFPQLPAQVPGLLGGEGGSDFDSRGWAAFFPVVLSAVLATIFLALPSIEPQPGKVLASWRTSAWVRGAVLSLLWWVQSLTLRGALGSLRWGSSWWVGTWGLALIILGLAAREMQAPPGDGSSLRRRLRNSWASLRRQAYTLGLSCGAGTIILSWVLSPLPLLAAAAGLTILMLLLLGTTIWRGAPSFSPPR